MNGPRAHGAKSKRLRAFSGVSWRTVEHIFLCPYCGEEISMILDVSVHRQTYVEDCEVCCHPIEISYVVEDGAVIQFAARTLE